MRVDPLLPLRLPARSGSDLGSGRSGMAKKNGEGTSRFPLLFPLEIPEGRLESVREALSGSHASPGEGVPGEGRLRNRKLRPP